MKLLFTTDGIFPDFMGGMQRHSFFLIKNMAKKGVDIDVIHPTPGKTYFDDFSNVKEYCVEMPESSNYLLKCWKYAGKIDKFVDPEHYDAAYGQGFTLLRVVKGMSCVSVYNPHGLEMFQTLNLMNSLKSIPFRWMVKRLAKYSDITISLGGKLTNILRKKVKLSRDKIRVLPNGVEIDYVDSHRNQQSESEEKISNSFLFVGRIAYNKGLTYLLSALEMLERKDIKIFIAGSGPLKSKLEKRSDDRITFLGRVSEEDLFAWYDKVECFILPTLYEGMPTVILEAMSCELPVLASDIGAVSTMVSSDNGILMDPGDKESICNSINRFLDLSPEEKRRMGTQWLY